MVFMTNVSGFSVVIPAFNSERFILKTLDSVAGQTFCQYEIIVVDDGSTDCTYDTVNAWKRRNSSVSLSIIRQSNGGIGSARNAGIRAAKFEYVAFLDSDDLWLDVKLETLAKFLIENPQVDLVSHDVWIEQEGKNRKYFKSGPRKTYRDLLFYGNCIVTSAAVVRRKILDTVGGFSTNLDFNSSEDYELWLRIARNGASIDFVHKALGIYRVHNEGISSRNIELHCRKGINVLENHFVNIDTKNFYYSYLKRRSIAVNIRAAGYKCMASRRHEQAGAYLRSSLVKNPFDWKTWVLLGLNLLKISI